MDQLHFDEVDTQCLSHRGKQRYVKELVRAENKWTHWLEFYLLFGRVNLRDSRSFDKFSHGIVFAMETRYMNGRLSLLLADLGTIC